MLAWLSSLLTSPNPAKYSMNMTVQRQCRVQCMHPWNYCYLKKIQPDVLNALVFLVHWQNQPYKRIGGNTCISIWGSVAKKKMKGLNTSFGSNIANFFGLDKILVRLRIAIIIQTNPLWLGTRIWIVSTLQKYLGIAPCKNIWEWCHLCQ